MMLKDELLASIAFTLVLACIASRSNAQSQVPFPQPVISEVLFAVPNDDSGDANKDGVRDAVGDEFIEVFNPHGKPINLRGVVLTSRRADPRNPGGKKGVAFVFPDVELAPGQCAVVFNGLDARIGGPVGTTRRAPEGGNPEFGGALVFTVGNESKGRALANSGDFVLLSVADGSAPLECVAWGSPKEKPPAGTGRVFKVDKRPGGSVVRVGAGEDAVFLACPDLEGVVASPGVHGIE